MTDRPERCISDRGHWVDHDTPMVRLTGSDSTFTEYNTRTELVAGKVHYYWNPAVEGIRSGSRNSLGTGPHGHGEEQEC